MPGVRGDSGVPRLSPGRGAGEERDREPREEQGHYPGIWDQGDVVGDGPHPSRTDSGGDVLSLCHRPLQFPLPEECG